MGLQQTMRSNISQTGKGDEDCGNMRRSSGPSQYEVGFCKVAANPNLKPNGVRYCACISRKDVEKIHFIK